MIPPENLVTAGLLAVSIGPVAYTVSSSKVSTPLRVAVMRRAIKHRSKRWRWFADLLACPYCVSHWLAFAATVVYRPWVVDANLSAAVAPGWFGRVFDFFVTAMVMVALAMVPVWVIKRALAPVAAPPAEPTSDADRLSQRPPAQRVPTRLAPSPSQAPGPRDIGPDPAPAPGGLRPDQTMVDPIGATDRTQVL